MAPDFLALATTLENLGARRLLAKKVNFVPCNSKYACGIIRHYFRSIFQLAAKNADLLVNIDLLAKAQQEVIICFNLVIKTTANIAIWENEMIIESSIAF